MPGSCQVRCAAGVRAAPGCLTRTRCEAAEVATGNGDFLVAPRGVRLCSGVWGRGRRASAADLNELRVRRRACV